MPCMWNEQLRPATGQLVLPEAHPRLHRNPMIWRPFGFCWDQSAKKANLGIYGLIPASSRQADYASGNLVNGYATRPVHSSTRTAKFSSTWNVGLI